MVSGLHKHTVAKVGAVSVDSLCVGSGLSMVKDKFNIKWTHTVSHFVNIVMFAPILDDEIMSLFSQIYLKMPLVKKHTTEIKKYGKNGNFNAL